MPQNKHHKKIILGSLLVGLLVGLCIGVCVRDFPILQRDDTIDISEIFSIVLSFLTLGVGAYIALILDRTKKKEEYKYDYVFSKVENFRKSKDEVVSTILSNSVAISVINSKLKMLSMLYKDVQDVMKMCGMLEITFEEQKEFMNLLKYIKRLCTESPRYKMGTNVIAFTNESELAIENKIITYSPIRQDIIEKHLLDLTNVLFKLVVEK